MRPVGRCGRGALEWGGRRDVRHGPRLWLWRRAGRPAGSREVARHLLGQSPIDSVVRRTEDRRWQRRRRQRRRERRRRKRRERCRERAAGTKGPRRWRGRRGTGPRTGSDVHSAPARIRRCCAGPGNDSDFLGRGWTPPTWGRPRHRGEGSRRPSGGWGDEHLAARGGEPRGMVGGSCSCARDRVCLRVNSTLDRRQVLRML